MTAAVSISAGATGSAEWRLSRAVLVYQSRGGRAYATLHDIEDLNGRLQVGGGVPATKEACAQLARSLGAAATLTGFAPPNLLYLGARSILWWRPAAPARLFFDTTGDPAGDQIQDKKGAALIGKRNGVAAQPGLVFGVAPRGWYVYAMDGSARPGPETKLLRAPYFNVWTDGKICTGNVRLPDTLSTASLERYERAFFDSEFTHPNVRGKERLVGFDGGAYALWDGLLKAAAGEPFPIAALIKTNLTLEGLAARLEKGKGEEDE